MSGASLTAAVPAAGGRAVQGDLAGLARGGVLNLAGAAVTAVSGVGVVVVVARALPKDVAGTFYNLTSLVLIVATVARLGTTTSLVYFLAQAKALGSAGRQRAVLALAVRPALLLGLGCAAALVVAAGPVVSGLGLAGGAGSPVLLLQVLAVFLPLAVLTDVVLAATRGLGAMRPTVVIDRMGRTGAQLVLVAVAALTTGSVVLVALAWSLPYVPSAALSWRRFQGLSRTDAGTVPTGQPLTRREFWSFTAPRSLSSVVQIALQRLDILLVAAYLGPVEAALYTTASRFVVLGQLGNQAISLAAQPRLAAALATGDTARTNAMYRTATAWLVLASWPMYLLCMFFATELLSVFGPGYEQGRDVVLVLGAAMLLATACGMVDMVLTMAGRTSLNLVNNLLALVVNIGVDIVLIPRMGITGAAVGWCAAIVVTNIVPLAQIASTLRVHPFGRGVAVAVLLTATGFGLLPWLGGRLAGGTGGVALGAVLGAGLLVLGGYRERETLELGALVAVFRPAGARS